MRAVIDTNVLMAALLWRGPPHALLEHVSAGTVSLRPETAITAVRVRDELGRVVQQQALRLAAGATGILTLRGSSPPAM